MTESQKLRREKIAQAARERMGSDEARAQRTRVQDANRTEWLETAELDAGRKLRRVQAVTGLSLEEAEALVRREEAVHLPPYVRQSVELLFAPRAARPLLEIFFLDLARAAANAVARVLFRTEDEPHGTGFMISDRLFLTNNHVIATEAEAREFSIEFNHELDVNRRPRATTRFALAPEDFFVTDDADNLDFTVVAVGDREGGKGDLGDFGFCPLIATQDKHILGELVNIVQQPEREFKQIVLRDNQLVTRLGTVLHYAADTRPRSSGSPVFNDQWEVVALHHTGAPSRELVLPDGSPVPGDLSEGIRISAIVAALKDVRLNPEREALLRPAVQPPFRHPSGLRRT